MTFKEGCIVAEHYELRRQLGQGSFGDVWLAHNLLADIDVAIKFYGTLDQKGIEEFRNEFKIAYRLHHPNLLNISHFDVFENCPFLVMPYCENGSVSQRIGQMPEAEIWKFILDVSCGLAFLHNQNPAIVHQDIKPDNILITSDGRYVISDFGISRSFRTQMSRTNNHQVNSSGTLAYMGPERFSEKPMVVLASDICAFGMTLYEVVTGSILWEGMGGCVQLNGARIPTITGTTPELARLVSACLSAETWNRPTAQQIYDYAAAHLQHKQMPTLTYQQPLSPTPAPQPAQKPLPAPAVRPAPTPTPAPAAVARPVSPSAGHSQQQKTAPSPLKKHLLTAAAVLFGIIVIGAGAMFFHNSINEEQDFISCKTKEDFERFIQEHPSSSYVPTARKRIETLTPAERTAGQPAPHKTPQAPALAAPTTTKIIKENIQIVDKPAAKPAKAADDRIQFQSAQPARPAASAPSARSAQNDDDVFYACQTLDDYQSYLNTFPSGRHRTQARAAINSILNRNDNTVNDAEPRGGQHVPRHALRQNLPPRRGGGYGGHGHFRRP